MTDSTRMPAFERVLSSLRSAEGLYHRLVLLVGKSGSGKTGVFQSLAEELRSSVINVNLSISSQLLELTAKQRVLRLPVILGHITRIAQAPVLLDNIEILFDKDLQQDPLRLLQGVSRNQVVVASWNGTYDGGKLSYAESGHPEYRVYDSVDAMIVEMDITAAVDSKTSRESGQA